MDNELLQLIEEYAAHALNHAFRLAGRARGEHDVEGMVCRDLFEDESSSFEETKSA